MAWLAVAGTEAVGFELVDRCGGAWWGDSVGLGAECWWVVDLCEGLDESPFESLNVEILYRRIDTLKIWGGGGGPQGVVEF